jgi:hypothetical protein
MNERDNAGQSTMKYDIKNFPEYIKHARSTALYTDTTRMPAISGLMYSTLGIANEFCEFLNAAMTYAVIIDAETTDEDWNNLLAEAGDVFWYAANICCDIGVEEFEYTPINLPYVDDINDRVPTAVIIQTALNTGWLSGIIKKIYRDQSVDTLKEFPIIIEKPMQLENILTYVKTILNNTMILVYLAQRDEQVTTMDLMQRIMSMNIEKLYSRRDRGVLHGSGDHR